MTGKVDARLRELGLVLPEPQKAWANYVSYAARACAINLLSHLKVACGGDLDRVARCVEVGGFVNSAPDFYDHPKVLNGASDLLVEVLGEAGRHTRFAVGVAALPFDFAVEVKAIFEVSR